MENYPRHSNFDHSVYERHESINYEQTSTKKIQYAFRCYSSHSNKKIFNSLQVYSHLVYVNVSMSYLFHWFSEQTSFPFLSNRCKSWIVNEANIRKFLPAQSFGLFSISPCLTMQKINVSEPIVHIPFCALEDYVIYNMILSSQY